MNKYISGLWLFVCFVRAFTFPATDNSVVVVNSYNEPYDGGVNSNGYKFGYELSDGQKRAEIGSLVKNSNNEDSLVVEGSYAFNAPEGDSFMVSYVADDKGYRPRVNRLKTNVLQRTGAKFDKFGADDIDLRFGKT